jgi:hypothetical protein
MNTALLTFACATCIGQDHQITTLAANGAVYVMFGALALVFSCIIAVVLSFVRRARRYAASQSVGNDPGSLL